MKRQICFLLAIGLMSSLLLSSCGVVTYVKTSELRENYEKKIHHTTLLGKAIFKTDKKKMDTYNNVKVYMNESEIGKDFEVVAFGQYRPIVLPLIRPERPRIEKYLFWKAARKARKLGANGAIIDNKNNFRVIQTKE